MDSGQPEPADIHVPEGRDRLGRAHQLRVDISIAISMAPAWLRRALGDKDAQRSRGARVEMVERVAAAIERRFRVTWLGSDEVDPNARPLDATSPLFGGPVTPKDLDEGRIDDGGTLEHKGNDLSGGVV